MDNASPAPAWAKAASSHLAAGGSGGGSARPCGAGVALLEGAIVVGPDAGEPGVAGDEQVVHELAALGGVALRQGQVLGGEQHGPQHAEGVSGPGDRRAVHPGAVGLARVDLQFDQRASLVALDLRADDGPGGAVAYQRSVGRHPVGRVGRDVADGLDQIGLALPVGPDEGGDPGFERQLGGGVGPEVRQRQVGGEHAGNGNGLPPRSGARSNQRGRIRSRWPRAWCCRPRPGRRRPSRRTPRRR